MSPSAAAPWLFKLPIKAAPESCPCSPALVAATIASLNCAVLGLKASILSVIELATPANIPSLMFPPEEINVVIAVLTEFCWLFESLSKLGTDSLKYLVEVLAISPLTPPNNAVFKSAPVAADTTDLPTILPTAVDAPALTPRFVTVLETTAETLPTAAGAIADMAILFATSLRSPPLAMVEAPLIRGINAVPPGIIVAPIVAIAVRGSSFIAFATPSTTSSVGFSISSSTLERTFFKGFLIALAAPLIL